MRRHRVCRPREIRAGRPRKKGARGRTRSRLPSVLAGDNGRPTTWPNLKPNRSREKVQQVDQIFNSTPYYNLYYSSRVPRAIALITQSFSRGARKNARDDGAPWHFDSYIFYSKPHLVKNNYGPRTIFARNGFRFYFYSCTNNTSETCRPECTRLKTNSSIGSRNLTFIFHV